LLRKMQKYTDITKISILYANIKFIGLDRKLSFKWNETTDKIHCKV